MNFFTKCRFLQIYPILRIRIVFHNNLSYSRYHSWKIMFFGNDDFSLASLKEIFKNKGQKKLVSNLEVVTYSARENPVKKFAESNNIKIHDWPPNLQKSFDLGVVVSFGKLIPPEIINHFPLGMINVHGSLLPRWRGGTPIIHSIMNGDKITGVSIMQIRPKKFDIGGVLMQKSIDIGPDELMPELRERLGKLGAECLVETIKTLPEKLKNMKEQSNENVSYAPKIQSSVAVVSWTDLTALQIYNRYRGLYSMYHLKTTFGGEPLKLNKVRLLRSEELLYVEKFSHNRPPGSVKFLRTSKLLVVQCKDNPIGIESVRFNHKVLNANDFYSGYLSKIPKSEWKFI